MGLDGIMRQNQNMIGAPSLQIKMLNCNVSLVSTRTFLTMLVSLLLKGVERSDKFSAKTFKDESLIVCYTWHTLLLYLQVLGPHTVDVDGKLYSARNILISVGGRPFIPDIPGSEYAIDSDAALDLPTKPKKIAIVGGGYIALEFAGIFNGLKSEVHVFIRQKKVLRGFDEDVS